MTLPPSPAAVRRGRAAHRRGLAAEAAACAALEAEGWTVLGRRLRTEAGEVDAVAEKDGLLAVLEVKSRPTLAAAAAALSPRQRARLLTAGAILRAAMACGSTCWWSMPPVRCAASPTPSAWRDDRRAGAE
jgi:Holliday junction resolvase-like predicted endonuclease